MNVNDPVSTVMTRTVIVAHQYQDFSEVLELFSRYGMNHLPVVDDKGHLAGIISSNDFMKLFLDPKYRNVRLDDSEIDKVLKITEIMTPNPVTISSTDTIRHAAQIFSSKKFRALPVVDGQRLVGILSIKDIVHLIAQ